MPSSLLPKPKKTVRVTLTNRQAIFHCSPERQKYLKKYFRYNPKGFEYAPSYKEGSWDGFVNMMQRGRVASGLFLEMKSELEKRYKLIINDQRIMPKFSKEKIAGEDRQHQNRADAAMQEASSTGGVVLAATGSGKTRQAAKYFKKLQGVGLFVCDELTLLYQSQNEISEALSEPVGVVGNSKFEPKRITVATVQTLFKHRERAIFKKWYKKIDIVFIDEIHVAVNRRNIDVVKQIKPLAVFGLTATLELQKPEVRFPVIALTGPVIFEYTIQEGVDEGHLTEGEVRIVEFRDPLRKPIPGYWSEARDKQGNRKWIPPWHPSADYRWHICLNKARNDLIERLVREGLEKQKTIIVLTERKNHLKILSARFPDVAHRVLSGDKKLSGDSALRIQAMKEMDAGEVSLLIASKVFGKGVNIKRVDCIIDATAMPSRNAVIQRYGRGVRKFENKQLLYFDIADRGNNFEDAAYARERALRELGVKITREERSGKIET